MVGITENEEIKRKIVVVRLITEICKGDDNISKIVILALNGNEDTIIEKIVSALSDEISMEFIQPVKSPVLLFPGLEIKLYQRRVLRDGEDVPLTRLEYGTLAYLASNPGIVFTQTQIFEAVWNMESDSCNSSVVNVIYNLRKKIEVDNKNPVYIITLSGVGYKFGMERSR